MRTPVKGKASVPLFVDGETAVQGSFAIGEHVDSRGKKDKLFPEGKRETIKKLFDDLEDPLSAAREAFVRDLMNDEEAQLESLPPLLRSLPFAAMSAKIGTTFVTSKYNARIGSVDDRIRAGLRRVSEALGKKDYILDGGFSFADIVATSIIMAIAPGDDKYVRIAPGTRRLWNHAKLQKEFAHLIEWRDMVYSKHRPKSK
jgi:glutathione S-transferase